MWGQLHIKPNIDTSCNECHIFMNRVVYDCYRQSILPSWFADVDATASMHSLLGKRCTNDLIWKRTSC